MAAGFFLDAEGYHAPALSEFAWLMHAFGTRHTVPPASLATVKQVHSVEIAAHVGGAGVIAEADGITSNFAGVPLGIKTADCLPILLVDPRHRAIAAVHAGWRGVAGNIVARAIVQMSSRFGSAPEDLIAAVGPGIGECCFEVGPEVAVQFGREGRVRIDLTEVVKGQFAKCGVPCDQVHAAGLCTVCDAGRFHSFRRDGAAAGRMMSVIGILQPAYEEPARDLS